jgi:hypothetical protein
MTEASLSGDFEREVHRGESEKQTQILVGAEEYVSEWLHTRNEERVALRLEERTLRL